MGVRQTTRTKDKSVAKKTRLPPIFDLSLLATQTRGAGRARAANPTIPAIIFPVKILGMSQHFKSLVELLLAVRVQQLYTRGAAKRADTRFIRRPPKTES